MSEEEIIRRPVLPEPEEVVKRPNPKIFIDKWKRFPQKLDFTRPNKYVIQGMPEGGKSALVETVASKYDDYSKRGVAKIIDLFASRDNEGLSWLRHQQHQKNALLIHGDSVKLSCEWKTKKISELKLYDIMKYDTVISSPAFYSDLREEWQSLDKVNKMLWRRTHWDEVWFLCIREGTSLLYSRLGLGENQSQAKASFVYALKEFRHCGMALGIDIIRYYGLDTEVRALADYLFVKAQGIEGLANDLSWMYGYYDLFVDFMQMPPWCFVVATKKGGLGNGRYQYPYWHKEERESMLDIFNIQIEYSDGVNYGDKGYAPVSDFEHGSIVRIRVYCRTKSGMMGMGKIAKGGTFKIGTEKLEMKKRSPKTIQEEIHQHNADIEAKGQCRICSRIHLEEESTIPI